MDNTTNTTPRIHVFPSTYYSGVDLMAEIVKTYAQVQDRLILRSGLIREVIKSREDLDFRPGDLVIAERGVITYLAAAIQCSIIEIYPDNKHRGWMSKWLAEGYRMIYGVRDANKIMGYTIRAMKDWVTE